MSLEFLAILQALEKYVGLTGWLRKYIPYYAQIIDLLQKRKTCLLESSPSIQGHARKSYTMRTVIKEPTQAELGGFAVMQKLFSRPTWLAHFNHKRPLYMDLDASKERGFGVVVYHVKGDYNLAIAGVKRQDIEPILFLSKMLTTAESHY